MKIDFAEQSNINNVDLEKKHRLRVCREFIGCDLSGIKSLDISDRNYVGEGLGVRDNTLECNFNYKVQAPDKDYDVVICLETIEHVMNPLSFLEQVCSLMKRGGKMYISTPLSWTVSWYLCGFHFVEYRGPQFVALLEYAGFKITRQSTFSYWPWYFVFMGIKPIFRKLIQRGQIYECEKAAS